MALVLRDPNEAFWVTDDDLADISKASDIRPDAEVAYYVRPCPDVTQREIRKELVTLVFDRKTRQRVESPLSMEEQAEVARRVFCYVLQDWRGIVDPKTAAPVPCTDEAKRAFMAADAPRVLAIFQVIGTLATMEDGRGPDSFRRPEGVGAVVD